MFKAEIVLKQHTPIIHFQHDQEGATLRATEVKPKLDRFIYKYYSKLFPNETQGGELNFFDPESKNPSPYKLGIRTEGDIRKILIASRFNVDQMRALDDADKQYLHNVAFFAEEQGISKLLTKPDRNNRDYVYNEDKEKEIQKWGLYTENPILLTISSFNKEVIKIIQKALPYLFAYENFGTRQNKGFGSFSVVDPQLSSFEELIKKVYPYCYQHTFNFRNRHDDSLEKIQALLEKVNNDYQLMKSGKNHGGYKKSLLFLYGVEALNPAVRWEKRKIKKEIHSSPYRNKELYTEAGNSSVENQQGNQSWNDGQNTYNYKYLRLALGMAEQYQFITKQIDRRDGSAKKDFNNLYVAKIKAGDIERYKSPLLFKVFNDTIYVLAEDISPDIQRALTTNQFNFDLIFKETRDGRSTEHNIPNNHGFSLGYPQDFRIDDFLDYVFVRCSHPEKINGYQKI